MKFTVTWTASAENKLAELWNDADSTSRSAITKAANRIDKQLATDPQSQGESRSEGRRILIEPPLAVVFRVFEPDRKVVVLRVRLF